MGKSEVALMPIDRQASIFSSVKMSIEEEPTDVLEHMAEFTHQVAGHISDGTCHGFLKSNHGTVLKPINNQQCGTTEIQFYEDIARAASPMLAEAKDFMPKFHGTVTVPLGGKPVECLVLEDLTRHYKEPCIMDIKMGRRTWDPAASYQKIMKEETKYQDCKRDLGFCIPGFQVYKLDNGQVVRFGKDFGKGLDKESVPNALRTFLNGDAGLCRSLIVQFLASLWRLQLWFRKQRHYHFFSSSLLLVYDARRLRELVKSSEIKPMVKLQRSTSLYRPLSLAVLNSEKIPTGFSGQLTNQGPIFKTTRKSKEFDVVAAKNKSNVWQKSFRSLKRTHSFQNNYDKDIQCKRQDYTYILDELCEEQKSELWASVKMIDFAHTFPAEHHQVDANYLDGIDHLIRFFEEFLVDSV